MKGIIIASHGRLAEGMLDTLQIFSGEQKQVKALCLLPEEDVQEFLGKLQSALQEVDTGEGAIIFCDLLFGTPCNCGARILSNPLNTDKISVITGMNLPMIMEYMGAREVGMEREALVETGKAGIVDFNKMLAERNQ
ncbi:MAG: PTS sugar transporter subunit IIA [Longicatena sp.]